MSFYGASFLYNGIASETYGLKIASLDSSGATSNAAGSNIDILEQRVLRKPIPYFLGVTLSPKLQFELSAYVDGEMDATMFASVSKWLFGQRSYKRFEVNQPDLAGMYWNVLFSDPKVEKVGNLIRGFSCKAICNAPFGFYYPKVVTYSFVDATVDSTVIFNNTSDDGNDYIYPSLTIVMNSQASPDMSITNSDDGNRIFSFTDVSAGETLIVDCYRQTITSSTSLIRIGKFNKAFLRLKNGLNHLRIQGNVARIDMTTQFISKKI
jgi:phage-related protein